MHLADALQLVREPLRLREVDRDAGRPLAELGRDGYRALGIPPTTNTGERCATPFTG